MAEPIRIKEIPESEMTAEQKKVFEDLVAGRGRLLTPYKIWIHSPKLAAALETIGTFLNKKSSLSEREVELDDLHHRQPLEGRICVGGAREDVPSISGFPQSVFDAIRAGQTPKLDNERERAVYDLAKISMEPGGGSDEVFEPRRKAAGPQRHRRSGGAAGLLQLGLDGDETASGAGAAAA